MLVCAVFRVVIVRLRLGCVWLRGGERVQAIDEADGGVLDGVTSFGGVGYQGGNSGYGVVFKVTPP
jgi:hypothetical protein